MNERTARAEAPARTRVRLRLFGAFREVSREELTLEVAPGTTVAELRDHVKEALRSVAARRHERLVDLSALALDDGILPESHPLGGDDVCLSILPPVCGG